MRQRYDRNIYYDGREICRPSWNLGLWFGDMGDAHAAKAAWIENGHLDPDDELVYLKELRGRRRGWGFYDEEVATQCRLATSQIVVEVQKMVDKP